MKQKELTDEQRELLDKPLKKRINVFWHKQRNKKLTYWGIAPPIDNETKLKLSDWA